MRSDRLRQQVRYALDPVVAAMGVCVGPRHRNDRVFRRDGLGLKPGRPQLETCPLPMIPCHPPTLLFKIEGARRDQMSPTPSRTPECGSDVGGQFPRSVHIVGPAERQDNPTGQSELAISPTILRKASLLRW